MLLKKSDTKKLRQPLSRLVNLFWPILPFIIISICITYAIQSYLYAPNLPFTINANWTISSANECPNSQVCPQNLNQPINGDQLLKIGDLTYEAYINDWSQGPFAGLQPGQTIFIDLIREEEPIQIEWQVPTDFNNVNDISDSVLRIILILPFWLVATIAVFRLRPRDKTWYLFVLTNYSYSLWLMFGLNAVWQLGYSALLVRVLSYFLAAFTFQLYWSVPTPLFNKPLTTKWSTPIYIGTFILSLLDALHFLPQTFFYLALLLQIITIMGLVTLRLLSGNSQAATKVMALSGGIIFVTLLEAMLFLSLSQSQEWATNLFLTIFLFSLTTFPFYQLYAIFQSHLSNWEPIFYKTITLTGFICLFVATASLILYPLWLQHHNSTTFFIITILFLIITIPLSIFLYQHFQYAMGLLAYGRFADLSHIAPQLAVNIPAVPKMMHTVEKELTQHLGIQGMATFLWTTGSRYQCITTNLASLPQSFSDSPITSVTTYLPPQNRSYPHVALVLPLTVQGQILGYWWLGERQNGRFYPSHEIENLTLFANQMALLIKLRQTLELQQEVERQTAQQLREVSLGRLIAGLSHELNTPMQVVLMNLEMMKKDYNQDIRWQRAMRQAAKMRRIVYETLNFAKPLNPQYTEINIAPIMERSAQFYNELQQSNLIQTNIAPLPKVMINPTHFEHIIDNFIRNAIDAEASEITISAYTSDENHISVTVQDNGHGIDLDDFTPIFEPFMTTRDMGTGLGLHLVKRIVNHYSGTVQVSSTLEIGTIFTVTIPIKFIQVDETILFEYHLGK